MKRRKLSAREVALLFRVRDQLDRINRPWLYRAAPVFEVPPTFAELKDADLTICMMEIVPSGPEQNRLRVRGDNLYKFVRKVPIRIYTPEKGWQDGTTEIWKKL